MSALNWDIFLRLPGAPETNFEKLCRGVIRRHYGQFGLFKELANQAGVEFHLKLERDCDLGKPPRWFGWQCKWYQITNGQKLGATRRAKILDGLEKTSRHLPELTDWILWTRHTLTKEDQTWFYGLKKNFPKLELALKTSADLELLLAGPANLLRESYFGELIVTPLTLAEQYRLSSSPFSRRYQPEVHQVTSVEEMLLRSLAGQEAWSDLSDFAKALDLEANEMASTLGGLKPELLERVRHLEENGHSTASHLSEIYSALGAGDLNATQELLKRAINSPHIHDQLLAALRSARKPCALYAANLIASIYSAKYGVEELHHALSTRLLAVTAAAGEGKSELAVRLAAPVGEFPGGVLLLGKNLHAGQNLDHLASAFKIAGKPVQSFEHLAEALDAAGQRVGRRLPIIVDGLNEAEDPRNWKDALFQADEILKKFPYVLLVVTLRNEFLKDCIPEQIESANLESFKNNLQEAIERYFDYYKIDLTDADLPRELLQHPLTLRIYCEVANPSRQKTVGVEALPRSLSGLFEAHFKKIAERVADLSPASRRVYQQEVEDALLKIGQVLWKENSRSAEIKNVRQQIGDAQDWNSSLIRSLESEGVLIRTTDPKGQHGIGFAYDLMAGHLIAKYLIYQEDIGKWLKKKANLDKIDFKKRTAHTLAWDIFRAMIAILPTHLRGSHLWQYLPEDHLQLNALLFTAVVDPAYIDRETTDHFKQAMLTNASFANASFGLLKVTRAAYGHPYDAVFLSEILASMSNTNRDLTWTEWLRRNLEEELNDIKFIEERWTSGRQSHTEVNRARWILWTLTTTARQFRDHSTKALYAYALQAPAQYFEIAVDSLCVSDPYVPERAMAAAYGAALSKWSDPSADEMRSAVVAVVPKLLDIAFRPDAPGSTRHVLTREYCLGLIGLARKIDPSCISTADAKYLVPPFAHLPTPFGKKATATAAQIQATDDEAIRMDFGNYTIGRLIPDRSNYDYKNKDYIAVRREIVKRMIVLGYEPKRFSSLTRPMAESSHRGTEHRKIDRYGKKYSWIAYFEMWGWRSDKGKLPDWRQGERTPDVEIDPSFPTLSPTWSPPLADIFSAGPKNISDWVFKGPVPNYEALLRAQDVGGIKQEWVLLDGFIIDVDRTDYRGVFTFLRGILVPNGRLKSSVAAFNAMKYPGNDAIPSSPEFHYRYAGEMPFPVSPYEFTSKRKSGRYDDYDEPALRWNGLKSILPVEIPVQAYAWESYHSELNNAARVILPSTSLCDTLDLGVRPGTCDLYDVDGIASLHRRIGDEDDLLNGHLTYLRADLLQLYLKKSKKTLVWLIWGEREQNYRGASTNAPVYSNANYEHIHKSFAIWPDAKVTMPPPATPSI